jgi:hypothetical protein
MIFMAKTSKVMSLIVLTSLLVLTALTVTALNVQAQSKATVNVLDSIGGTTDPAPGTYSYDDGSSVTFTASSTGAGTTIPANFAYWIVSSNTGANTVTDNPMSFTVSGGVTYEVQAVFNVIQPVQNLNLTTDLASAAIVVVLPAAGGMTIPAPGTYALANATALELTAMADNGWQFTHWVITGSDVNTGHGSIPTNLEPTDNPYKVDHGYGNTYYYQPVFTQSGSTSPSPTIPELSAVLLIAVLVAMIPIVLVARRTRKTKS